MAESLEPVVSCSNTACNVRVDGICAEGRALTDCPYLSRGEDAPGAAIAPVGSADAEDDDLEKIPDAVRLSRWEAASRLGEYASQVVAIIGPSDAGKTTLIAGMYDQFQHGAVSSFEFAGSNTLHAFEQACHGARLESGYPEPTSERTHSGPAKFFELTLGSVQDGRKRRLLIADRWGEDYREAADNTPRREDFFEITRADVLTMLVDGGRLIKSESRFEVQQEILTTLQVFAEAELLSRKPRLALVLTKVDLVRENGSKDRALADFERIVEQATALFSDHFGEVSAFRTAASPTLMAANRGEGLADLLDCWIAGSLPGRYVRRSFPSNRLIDCFSSSGGI